MTVVLSPELEAVAVALEALMPGRVLRDAPLGARTTWRVGGCAAVGVQMETIEDFQRLRTAVPVGVPRLVVGRGSNLLVADAGFAGVAITLGSGFEMVTFGDGEVCAGGATPLPVLARQCAAAGQGGLGFYVGIPGSVGGAVRMNAGGHGRETREVLIDVGVVDLAAASEVTQWDRAALALGYRRSALGANHVVVDARFRVTPTPEDALRHELGEIVRWRTEHQPGGANAGSVFCNPPGDAAARLIDEECGLRGLRWGGATVSEKHANFIQADPGATAADVHELIHAVRDRVEQRTGVRLETEVREIGFDPR